MGAEDIAVLAVVALTMALAVGAMVLGGGWAAVRRQAGRLVVLAVLLLAVALAVRIADTQLDDSAFALLGIVSLVAGVPILYLQMKRLRQEPERTRLVDQRQRPAFWLLFGGFVLAMLAIPLVTILAGDR